MWETLCPVCGERMREAAIELHWDKPTTLVSQVSTVYKHFDGTSCSAPATSEGIDNLLGELRPVEGLRIHELRPEGEATRLAKERWTQRI